MEQTWKNLCGKYFSKDRLASTLFFLAIMAIVAVGVYFLVDKLIGGLAVNLYFALLWFFVSSYIVYIINSMVQAESELYIDEEGPLYNFLHNNRSNLIFWVAIFALFLFGIALVVSRFNKTIALLIPACVIALILTLTVTMLTSIMRAKSRKARYQERSR